LHLASRAGHIDFVQSLLAQGMGNIHMRSYEGRTPSQEASAAGHPNITQLLLQHGG
jgi:ankyrin repeat protein